MCRWEILKPSLPLELNPNAIKIWHGKKMKPVDLTGCDRIVIYHDTIKGDQQPKARIEFQIGRNTRTYQSDKEPFYIQMRHVPLKRMLFIDLCVN